MSMSNPFSTLQTQELKVLSSELFSLPSERMYSMNIRAVYQVKVRNSHVLYPTKLSDIKTQVQERLENSTSSASTTTTKK